MNHIQEKNKRIALIALSLFFVFLSSLQSQVSSLVPVAHAQAQTQTNLNPQINQSSFHLLICNGPDLSQLTSSITITLNGQSVKTTPGSNPSGYVPCNFQTLMEQIQFLINVMLVVGVLGVLIGLAIAGLLYIQGTEKSINRAKSMFPKIVWGFIIMLTAWFIVYQILSWLTGSTAASQLLGGGS